MIACTPNQIYLRFRLGAWVNAEPETLFTAIDEVGFRSNFAAFEATDFEVFSFLDTFLTSMENEIEIIAESVLRLVNSSIRGAGCKENAN